MTDPKIVTLPFLYKEELTETLDLGHVFTQTDEGEEIVEELCSDFTMQRIQSSFDINVSVLNALNPHPEDVREEDVDSYILSYLVSRMVLKDVNNPFLSYLFSVQEARKGIYFVDSDNFSIITREEAADRVNISASLADIPSFTDLHLTSADDPELVTLYCKFIEQISDGLFTQIPESFEKKENLTSLVEEVKIQTPRKYNLTSRGLTQSFGDDPIELTLSYAPPSVQDLAEEIQNDEVVFTEEEKIVPYLLLDLGYSPQQIAEWYGWESSATESYGINWLYDIQGEKNKEDPFYLQSYSPLRDLTLTEKLTYSPSVYTVLNLNDDLYPNTVRY